MHCCVCVRARRHCSAAAHTFGQPRTHSSRRLVRRPMQAMCVLRQAPPVPSRCSRVSVASEPATTSCCSAAGACSCACRRGAMCSALRAGSGLVSGQRWRRRRRQQGFQQQQQQRYALHVRRNRGALRALAACSRLQPTQTHAPGQKAAVFQRRRAKLLDDTPDGGAPASAGQSQRSDIARLIQSMLQLLGEVVAAPGSSDARQQHAGRPLALILDAQGDPERVAFAQLG